MKIKAIISIMLALAMVASTFVIGADPTENPTYDSSPPQGFANMTKKVWNGSGWADVAIADIDDIVRFNITIKYNKTSHINASSASDIWVNDTLPDCLEYVGNASHGPVSQSGKSITWYLPGPYWEEDKEFIEFDTKVVNYTDGDGEDNFVEVEGTEHCSNESLYGNATATVIVEEPPCGDIILTKKVWNGCEWVNDTILKPGTTARFNITVTYKADPTCGCLAKDIIVKDYWDATEGLEYSFSSNYNSTYKPSIAEEFFIQWNLTEDFDIKLKYNESVYIEFDIDLIDGYGGIENCAEVTAYECCCECNLSDSDCANVSIDCEPKIVIEKKVWANGEWSEHLEQVFINQTVRFKIDITWKACGPESFVITNMIVNDTLPCCLKYNNTLNISSDASFIDYDPIIETRNDGKKISWIWVNVRTMALKHGQHVTIIFDSTVYQYCECECECECECGCENIADVKAWGCEGPLGRNWIDEDNATVDCTEPVPVFKKLARHQNGPYEVEEINVTKGDMMTFGLSFYYYGEKPFYIKRFVDEMPCILEYRNNVNVKIYNECGTIDITDKFTVKLSEDGKTIWFNVTNTTGVMVEDSDLISLKFDAKVIGVTGTCNECPDVINYAKIVGYYECSPHLDEWSDDIIIHSDCPDNSAPSIPLINGPKSGAVGQQLTFNFVSEDQDGDDVYYKIHFSDESGPTGWLGPFAEGSKISKKHTFSSVGTYTIKAKAKDDGDHESSWTPEEFKFEVTITGEGDPCLEYDPESHNFGTMEEGETDSTTFEIWNDYTGTLIYTLTEDCDWINLSSYSGDSTGEHDTITIDIDTTGLSEETHSYDIQISSNGGDEKFTVTVKVGEDSAESKLSITTSVRNIGSVKATVENEGDTTLTEIKCKINISGGFLGKIKIEKSKEIDLPAGESENITADLEIADGIFKFGLGPISGTIEASVGSIKEEKTVSGLVIGNRIWIIGLSSLI